MFEIKIVFRDQNMPPLRYKEDTLQKAGATLMHALSQFAGVKFGFILEGKEKHVYWPDGTYAFTVPVL